MSDECLTKPCSLCGRRISGANWYCPECKFCICFLCAMKLTQKDYPAKCPKCGRKLD